MLQKDGKLLRARDESSGGGNRLGQRTCPDIDFTCCNAEVFIDSAAMGSEHPRSMRIIH